MRVTNIQGPCFAAGEVRLGSINRNDILNYAELKKFAEEAKLDLRISLNASSSMLPKNNIYNIVASRSISEYPFFVEGRGISMPEKSATQKELSESIYEAVLRSVKHLEKEYNAIIRKSGPMRGLK